MGFLPRPTQPSLLCLARLSSSSLLCRSTPFAFVRLQSSRALSTPTAAAIEATSQEEEEKYQVLVGQAVKNEDTPHLRINPVGIQLLSPRLHPQVFPSNAQNPPRTPKPEDIATSKEHLQSNGLFKESPPIIDPIDFDLPKLKGDSIDEHFHTIGVQQSEPYLTLAETYAASSTPDLPTKFSHASGWTKYAKDGSTIAVPYPEGETMLTFDVEVLYKIHPYPVMAAACSPDAWYFWLSPWVTGESSVQEHLVPLGPPDIPRVVVGHNVGYDRSKILEEYHLDGTKNRFLDTLSFHAASQGVSGTQRGAWRNHWKSIKEKEKSRNSKEKELLVFIEEMEQKKKDGEEIHEWPEEVAEDAFGESTTEMKSERVDDLLARSRKVLEALPPKEKASKQRSLDLNDFDVDDSTASPLSSSSSGGGLYTESESVGKVWTDVTALNSLGEVFKLHFYGEELDKSTREAFSATSVYGVRQDLDNLIRYCASDVHATHRVFREVFPRFRKMCPSPVSFGGLLTMGSPFLPIDKSWYEYVERSEAKYLELNGSVRIKLASLAEEARLRWTPPDDDFKLPPSSDYEALERLAKPDEFEDDEWLAQLDWTPKKARWIKWKAEEKDGMSVVRKKTPVGGGESSTSDAEALVPINLKEFQTSHVVPDLIDLTWQGRPLAWSAQHGWTYKMPATSPSMEDAGGSLTFTDPRDQSLNLETTSSDPSTRVVFFPLPALGKAAKVSKIFAKTWLKRKSNFDGLACADQELLDLVRDEADWVMIEGKIREIMSKKGMFGDKSSSPSISSSTSASPSPASPILASSPPGPPTSLSSPPSARPLPTLDNETDDADPSAALHLPPSPAALEATWWPKWYWDLFMPKPGEPHDQMNLTVRTQLSTLLLRLSWSGYPLYNSKEFGWVFRVPIEDADVMDPDEESRLAFTQGQEALEQQNEERAERQEEEEEAEEAEAQGEKKTRKKAAAATKKEHPDIILHRLTRDGETSFFKVPHPNGDQARVGSMIAKSSIKHIEDGVLTSVYPEAREAIQMNAQCSYWVSARSRVLEQMAVQESQSVPMGFASANSSSSPSPSSSRSTPPAPSPSTITPLSPKGSGIILPHVIVMGTITRRAIEKTWLTASNAKKNRVGSELKAMVKAPDGYAIVGADVDSEELWIAGLMGDAQFGLHGGSAIGWMTLEGTKSAGTDVHSKTAAIVGTSRDIAKIFNYSRIYGAGVNYAARLLLDSMKTPDEELAKSKADDLYAATKGKKIDRRSPNFHQFWHGGSESYLFNAIESVSRRLRPSTPALRCGITTALQEDYLEHSTAHMTSRINWVVQSSGVDYLHLLIVAMGHLCQTYDINARYLISVHDEVRYLVKKEDQERASLALQIANLWTRSLFAYKLGMDDLPQGCAFFSAVDIDSVLRKEVDMPCITPSNPTPVPPGETLDILQSIERTGGTLHKDRSPMTSSPSSPSSNAHSPTSAASSPSITLPPRPYSPPRANTGITPSANWPSFFLKAQAEQDDDKIDELWEKVGRPSDKTRAMYTARDRRKMFGSASPFQAGWKK